VFGDFALTRDQEAALEAHLELLMRWNRTLNLTAIRGREEAIERHYCESLFLASRLPAGVLKIVDVGSGAGFPGFPVAIMRPECLVTLVESHQRKAVFLRESSRSVPNIRVLASRAEQVNETFDRAISRAVSYGDLAPILKLLAPSVDLLSGAERPPEAMGFSWDSPVILPSGRQRFLWTGHRVVSRETER
jgi:16S rRNA (guanine527-N7)-methyltransferase